MEAPDAETKQEALSSVEVVPLLSETAHPSHPKKPFFMQQLPQSSVPPKAVEYLKAWMMSPEHIKHPYSDEQKKLLMVKDTGIDMMQL